MTTTISGDTGVSQVQNNIVSPAKLTQPLTLGTNQTASGTSIDFTGIPSWVQRITVSLSKVSFAGAGSARLRIGSGALEITGYTGGGSTLGTGVVTSSFTDGIGTLVSSANGVEITGSFVLTLVNGTTWVSSGQFYRSTDLNMNLNTGTITLSGTLDQVALVATTSTFDGGSINILYEG